MFSIMCSKKLLVLCLYLMIINCSYGQRDKTFFRKDYKYFEDSQSFYKIHNEQTTWADAKKICELEGATFFYPDSTQDSFMTWWNSTQYLYYDFYIGVSSMVAKGVFETVDGRNIVDVYNKWGLGEPNQSLDEVACVVFMRRNGHLYDRKCTAKLPFICKKTLASLEWNQQCNSPNLDYHYNEEFDRCYKFHTTPLPWPEAHFVCAAEQSYLAVPNSEREADLLVNITVQAAKDRVKGPYLSGAVHLGFHNRMGDVWRTFRGSSLYDSDYTNWALNELDGEDSEQCGSMFYNGTLYNIDCKTRSFFICEHEIDILSTSNDDKFGIETVAVE